MPLDHLPPLQPSATPVTENVRAAKALRYQFGTHILHLLSFDHLPRSALDRLVREASTAEAVVLELSRMAYLEGQMSAQVLYAVDGNNVYVMLVQRPVRRLAARPDLQAFFDGAVHDGRIDAQTFERGRVLASAYADRSGEKVEPRLVETPDGRFVDLELRARDDRDADRFVAHVETNNHGSRFSGPNLLSLGLSASIGGGVQAALQGRTAPAQLNTDDAIADYREYELQLSRVGPGGVWGVGGRRLDFALKDQSVPVEGWYQEYGLEWSDVLTADLGSRWLLRLRGAYSDRQTMLGTGREAAFLEQYVLAEAAPTAAAALGTGRIEASLGIVGGWALAQIQSNAAEQVQILRPGLRLHWQQTAATAMTLTASGQWATAIVPEAQQWTLGGAGSLTAYVPATLLGDGGVLARLTQGVRFGDTGGWSLTVDLFGEYGSAERTDADRQSATDVGLSLGLSWRRTLELAVSAARPIGTPTIADTARADVFAMFKLAL